MALLEPREGFERCLAPFGGHPREMRHHAGAEVGPLGALGRRIAQLPERALHFGQPDVFPDPLLGVNGDRAQFLSHSRPSRRMSSLAAAGPHEPAA
jgi:hypothetical protein